MEMRRPLSEKTLGSRNPQPIRPTSQKAISAMKSSLQLQKQNQNFYSKYFSSKDQKENLEIKSNEVRIQDRPSSQPKLATKNPKEYLEYKKLQDKLQYLENKIITIKQHIDSSQKQPKSGLAAKFFQQQKPSTAVNPTRQSMIQQTDPTQTQQVKLKSNTISTDAGTSNTIVKKPSLSTFVTQVKFQSNENTNKNLVNKPESAKSTQSKQQFKRKVSSQDMQMYQSVCPVNFLFYISSIIKGYMQTDITRPIEQIREHLIQTMQACQYARSNKPTSQSIIDEKKVMLPDTTKRTIVFDLDETLIHCNESVKVPGDVILPIKFPTGEVIEASINIRPYAQQILQTLSRYFEVIVFTASHSCYANVVIDYLDPSRQWVSHRFFRESCVQSDEGAYLKDLRVIGNRQLSDLVLIDNAAYSFALQLQNGIPIVNFYDNKQDQVLLYIFQELLYLQNYIMAMKSIKDLRSFNQSNLKLDKFYLYQDPIELIQNLFKEYIP